MAANFKNSESGTFRLFQSSEDKLNSGGLGFLDFGEKSLLPPPPCVEVLPSEGFPPLKVSTSVKYTVEEINVGDVTLFKGRVSTQEVFALSNSDLIPGKYEGGLKLWEGSRDLVKALDSDIQNGHLIFEGKKVLELGCGHGLPGIYACLKGASAVHFQDFNAEVLRCLTIPNVNENISKLTQTSNADSNIGTEIRYFAGDWSNLKNVLPHARAAENHQTSSEDDSKGGYDVILMAETVYSSISHPHGTVYMAAKKHYFGVGGGSRQFVSIVEKDGVMAVSLIAEVADGLSNLREVWKLTCKQNQHFDC